MADFGFKTYGNSLEKFAETITADFAKMAKVIGDASIRRQ